MKRFLATLFAIVFACTLVLPAAAEDGKVTYSGNAGQFIFEPGGLDSPTDLFPNFKGVMPGDTLTQKITVRNDADNKVKVKVYMRNFGEKKRRYFEARNNRDGLRRAYYCRDQRSHRAR